jgi:hypothetical protein
VKRAVFAIVALLAAAAAGALVLPRHERDDRPLAGLFDDDVTIISAQRVDGDRGGLSQLVVNWGRTDPAQNGAIVEEGLSVYDEHPTGRRYRRTYVLDPPDNPVRQERHPIGHATHDLDDDGHDEILAIEDLDGSAVNHIYHLIARSRGRTRELYRKDLSIDDGLVLFGRDSLVTYEGVVRQPGDHGIHCCWSQYSLTVRKLRRGRLVVVQRSRTNRLPTVDDPPYSG